MSKSPGHRKWPEHKVQEQHLDEKVQVAVGGQIVAESDDVIKVQEDENPDRYYFPRSDIQMDALEPSETTTECPFKGTAHYYSLRIGDKRLKDAAWTYEEPFDEHRGLKDRVAFHDDRIQDIAIRPT